MKMDKRKIIKELAIICIFKNMLRNLRQNNMEEDHKFKKAYKLVRGR